MKMKAKKNNFIYGIVLLVAFAIWTVLIKVVDIQPTGVNGTDIGLAGMNHAFHDMTGVHMALYNLTDHIELLAIVVCLIFGGLGVLQLIQRKSLAKVDRDIILLGIHYVVVIAAYVLFDKLALNYRPILIEGVMEPSYPSSTTLLVMAVMPTLNFQLHKRMPEKGITPVICALSILFTIFVVACRTISGVHWLSDIIGSVLLSFGLFFIYRAAALDREK